MTRNLTNYHSHCSLCDGRAPMEDFVREAVRRGFTSYGISSHAPLPFPAVWTLDRGDVTTYLSEIERLKRSYAGRIELYAGMEIDYLDECDNPASDYFRQLPLDYRIGSVHLMHADDDFVGHVDKISYNAERCEPGITSRGWYRDKARECFERIAARGLLVEINTKKYNA